ncbi:hypothetical protein HDU93_002157, partial [Gonapodya sp. JEL0774]
LYAHYRAIYLSTPPYLRPAHPQIHKPVPEEMELDFLLGISHIIASQAQWSFELGIALVLLPLQLLGFLFLPLFLMLSWLVTNGLNQTRQSFAASHAASSHGMPFHLLLSGDGLRYVAVKLSDYGHIIIRDAVLSATQAQSHVWPFGSLSILTAVVQLGRRGHQILATTIATVLLVIIDEVSRLVAFMSVGFAAVVTGGVHVWGRSSATAASALTKLPIALLWLVAFWNIAMVPVVVFGGLIVSVAPAALVFGWYPTGSNMLHVLLGTIAETGEASSVFMSAASLMGIGAFTVQLVAASVVTLLWLPCLITISETALSSGCAMVLQEVAFAQARSTEPSRRVPLAMLVIIPELFKFGAWAVQIGVALLAMSTFMIWGLMETTFTRS